MSEWLDLMLGEITRKNAEAADAAAESERRKDAVAREIRDAGISEDKSSAGKSPDT